ncbi:tyrosine-type recombinase/integrase [Vibrio tubiashii]|uniref:tyrosine-type recombinase/integrase n=1 Tax=Vibrio tubiashii TaxID=29498 RepID=UPI001EFC553B|nr:tyrosine-type recombinase/integrase [Vibrio tubiashii]MCG9576655.1 tyrosine-type recombinase/integrase [Vibrio tubiashii]
MAAEILSNVGASTKVALAKDAISKRIEELEQAEINPHGHDEITAAAKLAKWFSTFEETTNRNTYRSYMTALERYKRVCSALDIHWLPITTSNMCRVLEHLVVKQKVRTSTLRLTATMVNIVHDAAGYYKPTLNKQVQLKLKSLGRTSINSSRQAKPLEYRHLATIVDTYLADGSLLAIRDACLASVMLDGLLRRSEAANIRLRDVMEKSVPANLCSERLLEKQFLPVPFSYREDEFLEGSLYIPYSKGDQSGQGAYTYLSGFSLRLISYMIEKMGLDTSNDNAFLFRGIETSGLIGESLSDQGVYRALQRMSSVVGEAVKFTGHSCRVGGCLELSRKKFSTHEIQHAGRWASPAMPAYYTRCQNVYEGAMAKFHKSEDTPNPRL